MALRYALLRNHSLARRLRWLRELLGVGTAVDDLLGDELVTVLVQQLVRMTNGAVADAGDILNLLGVLRLAHEVTGHVDACSSGRERRTTSQSTGLCHLLGQSHGDIGRLVQHVEHVAVTCAEILWISRRTALVLLIEDDGT